eukprot:s690_g23.t1
MKLTQQKRAQASSGAVSSEKGHGSADPMKGTVASASGSEVLLFNATGTEPPAEQSSETEQDKTPIGKVKLPVEVSKESCKLGGAAKDGGQVLRCKLEQEDVREVPIKVIDEL